MNVDPKQEVTLTVPAGAVLVALSAMAKQPFEQVAPSIAVMEQALTVALTPQDPPAKKE